MQDSSFCYPIMIKVGDFIVKTDFVSETRKDVMNLGNEVMQEITNEVQ